MLVLYVKNLQGSDDQEFELEYGDYILGRSKQADIVVDESTISREHLRIHYDKDEIRVTDLDSSNGIFVNGIKITEKKLFNRDKISIKNISIVIECEFDEKEESNEDLISEGSYGNEFGKDGPLAAIETEQSRLIEKDSDNIEIDLSSSVKDESFSLDDSKLLNLNKSSKTKQNKDLSSVGTLANTEFKQDDSSNFSGNVDKTIVGESKDNVAKKISLTDSLFKAFRGIFKGIEDATIKPFLSVILQFEYRLLVFILMALGVGLISFFVLFPQKIDTEIYLKSEALTNAENIAYFLAKFNRNALIDKDYEKLNIQVAMNVDAVQAARIIRQDGKIVMPARERYKDVTLDHLVRAVEAMRKGLTANILRVKGKKNVASVVRPIKAFTTDGVSFEKKGFSNKAEERIIGIAEIEYSFDYIYSGNKYTAITKEIFALRIFYCLLIGFLISFFITRLTIPVFKNLKNDLKAAQKTGNTKIGSYLNLKELDEFLDVLGETLSFTKSYDGSGGKDLNSDSMNDDSARIVTNETVEAFHCALQAVDTAVIVMDKEETVVIANDHFARLMQYGGRDSVEGQSLTSIVNDIEVIEKIKNLLDRLEGNEGTIITEVVDVAGFDTNISVSRSENNNFIAIVFKEMAI